MSRFDRRRLPRKSCPVCNAIEIPVTRCTCATCWRLAPKPLRNANQRAWREFNAAIDPVELDLAGVACRATCAAVVAAAVERHKRRPIVERRSR